MQKTTHPKRRVKSAPGQMSLPITRQQKFTLLRNAKFLLPGSKVRSYSRVYELLEQIEIHTGDRGCRVRINQLAEKMHCSRATVMRATKLAESLGVLGVGRDGDGNNEYRRTGGIGPNWYKVFWDRVRGYCDKSIKILASSEQIRPATSSEENKTTLAVPTDRRGAAGEEWNRVRRELREFGVINAGTASDRAWGNGLSPTDCLALLANASDRPAGYWNDPSAVLYFRLINARPGAAPDQDWPEPSKGFLLRQKTAEEHKRSQQERQDQARQQQVSEAGKVSRAELEREYGHVLESMGQSDLDSLAEKTFGRGPTLVLYQRKGIKGGLIRQSLISAISKAERGISCK